MKLSELVKQKRDAIIEIVTAYGGQNIRIFGSVAADADTAGSDLDLLVDMDPDCSLLDLIAIKQDLEDLISYPVDVVTESSLSAYLRDEIIKQAIPL